MRGLNLIDGVEGEGCVIYLTTVMILMGMRCTTKKWAPLDSMREIGGEGGCGVTQYFGLPCDNLEKLGSREFLSR